MAHGAIPNISGVCRETAWAGIPWQVAERCLHSAGMFTPAQQAIVDAAIKYARENKKTIGKSLTDTAIYLPEKEPVSVFMAGSPGAGKTESSRALVAELEGRRKDGGKVLRIDPDDMRVHCPGYDGHNSQLFQGAVSIIVDKVLDLAHEQKQSFILDGTLANYGRALANIQRCLRKGRAVQILYVYQDPVMAWEFVLAREEEEGRGIPVESFIDQYFDAREVVNRLKRELGADIRVDLLLKPHDASTRVYQANIEQIDHFVPETYDRAGLEARLKAFNS